MVSLGDDKVLAPETGELIGKVGEYKLQRLSSIEPIKQEWEALQQAKTACIYQHYDWINIAARTIERDNAIFIITARTNGSLAFILPMVIEKGGVKVLRWIGNSHANICSGLFSKAFLHSVTPDLMQDIFAVIKKSIDGICITALNNQPKTLKSYFNPMLHLKHQPSINSMYDMSLTDGFDAILDEGSGKRKRKLWRKQNRVAEEMGGYELVSPDTQRAKLEAAEEFMALKAVRLAELGVDNIFEDAKTREFFLELAKAPLMEGGDLFKIFQLKISGKTRAMYALGIDGGYCQAYVNAVAYDEISIHSPGEMVLYAMVQQLVEQGYEQLDLGVGDERYKRSWCPREHQLYDTIIPLSAMATPVVTALRIKNRIKRKLRNNPKIWLKLKQLRKAKANLFKSR